MAALSASSSTPSLMAAASRVLCLARASGLHTTAPVSKEQAGKYKVTLNRTKPLTYEMAMQPQKIASHKSWNSFNTAQLEDTFLMKEEMGQDLPHKTFMEDAFVRKFMFGTWPELLLSEVIIKRQHNLIRIAAIISRSRPNRTIYFLVGYTEELLSLWLKCPVKLELQSVSHEADTVYKYI